MAASDSSPLDSELIERLARMGVTVGVGNAPPPTPSPRPDVLPIESAVPGRIVRTDAGTCYVSTLRRAAGETHGGEVLSDAREASRDSLAALATRGSLLALDPARAAYLDTETTGLSGGTGTYAFLIGVGRFVGESFQVRQFFMRDPSEEHAQLVALSDWLSDCTGLVTFNGRSFDVPLLETRYTLKGLGMPLAGAPHLDLLPVSRRLWSRRLVSCALTSLEAHILGLERHDDVPGWLIPHRYLTYQREGDARPLVGIFRHNAVDILSMVSLVTRVARAFGQPEATLDHGADWLSLARVYASAGDLDRAVAACEGALERGLAPEAADEAFWRLSLSAKRAGDWPRAVQVWQDLASGQPRRAYPFEELAKYYEHRRQPPDLERALRYAEQARDLITRGDLRPRRGRGKALADFDHRIGRLRRRLARTNE